MASTPKSELKNLQERFRCAGTDAERHTLFEQIAALLSPVLRKKVLPKCGGREDVASDLLQEILVKLFLELRKEKLLDNPLVWCLKCISNGAIDVTRREQREQNAHAQLLPLLGETEFDPEAKLTDTDLDAILALEQERLSLFEKHVVTALRQGSKPREIALLLGVDVKKRIYPVIEKFKNRVRKHQQTPDPLGVPQQIKSHK